jgi:hypothetical protein
MTEGKANQRRKREARRQKKQDSPASPNESREISTFRRGLISAFILFHMVAIACFAIPVQALTGAKELFLPYLRWSGVFQSWDMFAPDPQRVDSYLKAVVITRDHHIKVWSFPRMEELGFGQRFHQERYRKFAEVLPQPQFAPLWPDVASHVARFFHNPADPPEKVMLIQFQTEIQPGANERTEPSPTPNVFYDDYLQPGDAP